jgi:hypothetical protein
MIRGPNGEEKSYEFILIDRLNEIIRDTNNVNDKIGIQKDIMWPYDYGDKKPDKEYFEAQRELGILESRLKILEKKERMINNLLDQQDILNPINNLPPIRPRVVSQDQGYEIPNGLVGVYRDIFNKLAGNRLNDPRDLQERYGISRRTFPWKDHFGFALKRPRAPPPDLNPEPLGHYRKK